MLDSFVVAATMSDHAAHVLKEAWVGARVAIIDKHAESNVVTAFDNLHNVQANSPVICEPLAVCSPQVATDVFAGALVYCHSVIFHAGELDFWIMNSMFTDPVLGQRVGLATAIAIQCVEVTHFLAYHVNRTTCSMTPSSILLETDRTSVDSVHVVLGGLHDTAPIMPNGAPIHSSAAGHTGDFDPPEAVATDLYGQQRDPADIMFGSTSATWTCGLMWFAMMTGFTPEMARQQNHVHLCASRRCRVCRVLAVCLQPLCDRHAHCSASVLLALLPLDA